jgi:glutamate dehydrogenase
MTDPIRRLQSVLLEALSYQDVAIFRKIQRQLGAQTQKAAENVDWLYANMPPYFFITMSEEIEAIVGLASTLHTVSRQRQVTLLDEPKKLTLARLDLPGSLYETLRGLQEREISYAEMTHSLGPLPGSEHELEIQRFEFDRKRASEICALGKARIPRVTRRRALATMRQVYPDFDLREFDSLLGLLCLNNPDYVRISPPERIARVLWIFQQGRCQDGLYLDVEATRQVTRYKESRILFAVGNPPERGFLTQVSEVFQRLNLGVRRSYSLIINTGVHPYFLGTFYVTPRDKRLIQKDSELFRTLKTELYNTQILSTKCSTYTNYVARKIMTGEEASIINALIAFCHTTLAHNQPDRFNLEAVKSAFQTDPDIALRLIRLFKLRFDPEEESREPALSEALARTEAEISGYNTGNRYLDEIRKTIFRTGLLFVRHTLKTNFFVAEKHALAFRLDPAYLPALGAEFTADLPAPLPFRVTFFFGRHGIGYHIGFSDIARGGWRTIICRTHDEYVTNANTLFRENFVLAHTQHLKNKDIYEGGSKLVVVLDASDSPSEEAVVPRLYKLQFGFINAFFDLFVTEAGRAKHPRVVDYYGEEEPIELGPDENMHDTMIEWIARQSVKRGYLLGIGIMSSKRVGINHKEYGVTSRGVIKFAEIAMGQLGIDLHHDRFTVKITGGTNGDVAGNALRLLLDLSPAAQILNIVAGSGAIYDPLGVDRRELVRLLLQHDVTEFDPQCLTPGGFLLFRRQRRQDGVRELHRKLVRTSSAVEEHWVTSDEFYRELDDLVFAVVADLFLPCGGRPETIDANNWQRMLDPAGRPTARVIVEGANSYITPAARIELQQRGVILLRDASANKCGVISSSYEIIANLLMSEKDFLDHKEAYVKDVLGILDRRAEDEVRLIFQRHRENEGRLLYTEISDALSSEINGHYARFFTFLQRRPELIDQPLFRRALLQHLPEFVRQRPRCRQRVAKLPLKYKYAILAVEIATQIVYHGGWDLDVESRLKDFLKRGWG